MDATNEPSPWRISSLTQVAFALPVRETPGQRAMASTDARARLLEAAGLLAQAGQAADALLVIDLLTEIEERTC